MGYKMKRGAKPKFNELGSSPIKGKGDNLKRIMTEHKVAAKKAGTWYAPGAEPKAKGTSGLPKNFNVKGSKGLLTNPTPGYKDTKMAKAATQSKAIDKLLTDKNISRKAFDTKLAKITGTIDPHAKTSKVPKMSTSDKTLHKNLNKIADRYKSAPKPTKIVHKGVGNIAKNVAKKVGKFIGGKTLGVAGMMMATSSKADQPKFKKGDVHYRDPKKSIF